MNQSIKSIIYLVILLSFMVSRSYSQKTKKSYQENQHLIDRNYGGVGITFMKPNLGRGIEVTKTWYDVNFLSDFFEAEFMMGETNMVQRLVKKSDVPPILKDYGNDFGYLLTIGANAPIIFLTFGSYKNPTSLLRGHPLH